MLNLASRKVTENMDR